MPENSKKMTNLRQIARPQVVVLAYDGLCTFEFGVAVEIFGLPRPELGDDWYRFAVASVDSGELRATGGIRIVTDGDLSLLASADLIVVPGWRGWIHRFRTRSASTTPGQRARMPAALHLLGGVCAGRNGAA
jgi:AraC family transcriptional activator FtrA